MARNRSLVVSDCIRQILLRGSKKSVGHIERFCIRRRNSVESGHGPTVHRQDRAVDEAGRI